MHTTEMEVKAASV